MESRSDAFKIAVCNKWNNAIVAFASLFLILGCAPQIRMPKSFNAYQTTTTSNSTIATQLVFTTEPANAVSEASLGSIVVKIEDGSGNVVTGSSASITLAIGNNAGPGGVLSGTTTVSAVSGVATFPGLSINVVGTGYTLTASSSSLTSATSSAFNITAGAPTQMVFTTEPSSVNSMTSLGNVAVTLEDADGNVCTSSSASVTIAIANNAGPGGTLSGTSTVSASSGVATFSNLEINKIGTGYTLQATAGALSATSTAFNITIGPAAQLAFTVEPTASNIQAGTHILSSSASALHVTVEDAGGNVETGSSVNVTVSIGSNPGGGTLSGTLTQATSAGVASFSDLWIDKAASGYTLSGTSGTGTGTSTSFTIVPAPPTTFTLTDSSPGLVNGCADFNVTTYDSYGNQSAVTSSTTFSITTPSSHLTFFSGAGCSGSITSFAMTSGSTYEFYGKDTTYENTNVQVAQSVWSVTQTVSYFAQTQLVITGPLTTTAGTCTTYTLTNEDALGAPITTSTQINATMSGYADIYSVTSGTFGTDSTCTTGTASLAISVGQSSRTFYYEATEAMAVSMLYSAANYVASYYGVTVTGSTPAALALTGPSVVTTGSCSPAFHASVLDSYNNQTTTTGSSTVTLSTTGATQFYSDPGCTTSLPSNQLTIAASQTYGVFYAESASSELATVTAAKGGWTSSTFKLLTQTSQATLIVSHGNNGYGNDDVCVAINGNVKCAGYGGNGRLGDGTTSNSFYPVQVTGLTSGVTQLATTNDATCAVTSGGVQCWGAGNDGDIGNGSFSDQLTPVSASVLSSNVTQIAAGDAHFCAIESGDVYCWGRNVNGQLGQGNTTDSNIPLLVILPDSAIAISAGYRTSCAVLNNGQLWCWGMASGGSLFNGGTDTSSPVQVTGPFTGTVSAVSLGTYEICVIASGTPDCWGNFSNGGTYPSIGLTGTYTQVTIDGIYGLYALRDDGSVWSYDNGGELIGNGTTTQQTDAESNITGGATSIIWDNGGACAVVVSGGQPNLQCWGSSASAGSYSPHSDSSISADLLPFYTFSWN